MHKIFLLTIGISTFLLAEYMSESDLLIQQNLEDIKNKYHIQDETPPEPVKIEKQIPQGKEELQSPDESVLTKEEPDTVDEIISSVKEALPIAKEPSASENEDKLERIRRELGIKELTGKEKELDAIRSELNINYEVPRNESSLDKRVTSIKDALHMDGEIEGEYSFSNTVRDLKKTLQLDGDSSWGMPSFGLSSLFGEEKKKKDKGLFGIDIPGINIPGLGGIQDTGKSIYKGMKYSGESAEMMSGMMYNSSKMYNTMFGMFDDSPFNIFEEEEEDSMFEFIQGGNSIMRMFE